MLRSNKASRIDVLLGERIRALRLKGNHSVLWLALQVGCSPSAYMQIEEGATRISASQLYTLAQAFGVGIGDFYDKLFDS